MTKAQTTDKKDSDSIAEDARRRRQMTKAQAIKWFKLFGYDDICYSGKKSIFYVTRLGKRISITIAEWQPLSGRRSSISKCGAMGW